MVSNLSSEKLNNVIIYFIFVNKMCDSILFYTRIEFDLFHIYYAGFWFMKDDLIRGRGNTLFRTFKTE